jgi:hypothetical protein
MKTKVSGGGRLLSAIVRVLVYALLSLVLRPCIFCTLHQPVGFKLGTGEVALTPQRPVSTGLGYYIVAR